MRSAIAERANDIIDGFAVGVAHRPLDAGAINRRDGGVATVYACLGCVLLLAVTGLAAHLGAGVLARQRAETAADLAALAGAAKILQGPDVACQRAVAVATANGATMESCSVTGADVLVTVSVQLRAGPVTGSAGGRARAGPVAAVAVDPGPGGG